MKLLLYWFVFILTFGLLSEGKKEQTPAQSENIPGLISLEKSAITEKDMRQVQSNNLVTTRIQRQLEIDQFFVSDDALFFATIGGLNPSSFTLWDARSMRQIREYPCEMDGVYSYRIQISESKKIAGALCKDEEGNTSLMLFSLLSDELIRIIKDPHEADVFDFSLSKNVLISREYFFERYSDSNDGFNLRLFNIETGNEIQAAQFEDISHIRIIEESDIVIATVQSEAVILELFTLEEINRIQLNQDMQYVNHLHASNDGRLLLVKYPPEKSLTTNKDGELVSHPDIIEVYDVKTGEKVISESLKSFHNEVAFSGDNHLIYFGYTDRTNAEGFSIQALTKQNLETAEMTELFAFDSLDSPVLSTFGDEGRILFSNDAHPAIFNENIGLIEQFAPSGIDQEYSKLSLFDNGKKAVIRSNRNMQILDFQKPFEYGETNHSDSEVLIDAGNGWWIADNADAYEENESDYWMTYELYHGDSFRNPVSFKLKNTYLTQAVVLDEKRLLIGAPDYSTEIYTVSVLSIPDGRLISKKSISLDESRMISDNFTLSSDRNLIATLMKEDEQNYIEIWDINQNLKKVHAIDGAEFAIQTSNPKEFVSASYVEKRSLTFIEYNLHSIDANSSPQYLGEHWNLHGIPKLAVLNGKMYCLLNDHFLVFDLDEPDQEPLKIPHQFRDDILDFVADKDNQSLILTGYNQSIRLNPELFEESYRAIFSSEKGVTITAPNGEYFAWTGDVPDHINFTAADRSYSFEQFDLLFNRPDKILSLMGFAEQDLISLYENAYQKRLAFHGGRLPKINESLPIVQVDRSNIQPVSESRSIDLSVSASDSLAALSQLHVLINGVPVFGKRGRKIDANRVGESYKTSVSLTLNEGLNRIEVHTENDRGTSSLSETLEIRYLPEGQEPSKPNLYFLAIGVSDYVNNELDLDFAAKDAIDLAVVFSGSEMKEELLYRTKTLPSTQNLGDVYTERLTALSELRPESFEDVNVKILLDRDVTRESILESRAFLEQGDVDDQIMIFIAGHGFLDDNLDYFFAPSDFDVENPASRGLRFDELESLTDGIPARRRLLIMDTCHSGELDRTAELTAESDGDEEDDTTSGRVISRTIGVTNQPVIGLQNSFELMRNLFTDLRHSSGMVTMSAASGVELAFETQSTQNGLFTYSFIEYLENAYQPAPLNKHLETISERVRTLSSDRQSPQFRSENRYIDVKLW